MKFLNTAYFILFGYFAIVIALPWYENPGSKHYARHQRGAVASESSVCSRIGVGLIEEGGNAADAVSKKNMLIAMNCVRVIMIRASICSL